MHPYLKNSLILCFFALLTVYFTWPLLEHIEWAMLSGSEKDDASLNLWDIRTFKHSLQNGESPFWINSIMAPLGADLTMHGSMPAMCFFCMPFSNDVLGMNLYVFLHFILGGFGAYLLAYRLTKHQWGSLIVGIIFTFSAFKMMRLNGHYMLIFNASVPFYILCFLQAFQFEEGKFIPRILSWKYVIFCALLGIFTALNDYYSTFYLLYFSIYWALYHKLIIYWKVWTWKRRLVILTIFFVVMHIIIQGLRLTFDDRGGFYWGGDVLSFFIPNSNTWLVDREPIAALFKKIPQGIEHEMFLGFTCILLLGYVLYHIIKKHVPKEAGPWLFMMTVFFLIMLPGIKIAGKKLLNSPTAALNYVPFINNIRCGTRIESLIFLLLPLLAVWIWTSRHKENVPFWKHTLLPLGIMLFLLIDLKPKPYELNKTNDTPAIFAMVKNSHGKILTPIPVGVRDGVKEIGECNPLNQYYQTLHHKDISGGYISRVPESTFEYYRKDSVMHTILRLSIDKNFAYTIPSDEDMDQYFLSFKTDMFLIEPAYRHSNAENYILLLTKDHKPRLVEQEGYLLVLLGE